MDPRYQRYLPILYFLLYVAFGLLFLRALTDWVSFLVDEGFTTYAAQRLREGQWPHRDFFFLWTPGILVWHALLQALGCSWLGERASALLAAGFSATLVLLQAREWGFRRGTQLLLAVALLAWGFTLWNIPYASWYALPFVLLGARWCGGRALLAGLSFVLAFWFKQNMGMLGGAGAVAALLLARDFPRAWRVGLMLLVGIALPFLGFWVFGGGRMVAQAFSQIFLFPLRYPGLMGVRPPGTWFADPLMLLGLWILALFSLQPQLKDRVPFLLRFAALIFLAYAVYADAQHFFLGLFMIVSCAAWGLAALMAGTELRGAERQRFWLFFLPTLGAFLQVFPRVDFQHFLFVFPVAFFFWLWGTERLEQRYTWIKGMIVWLPALALLWGGLFFQVRLNNLRLYGAQDRLGLISAGWDNKVNNELAEVIDLLHARGLHDGDPVLVMPNATTFYRLSGFHNPTPHDQFFPGYVEAFGNRAEDVLPLFERGGGRYIVWQYKSGLTLPSAMQRQFEENYQLVSQFPEHFSVWERKPTSE